MRPLQCCWTTAGAQVPVLTKGNLWRVYERILMHYYCMCQQHDPLTGSQKHGTPRPTWRVLDFPSLPLKCCTNSHTVLATAAPSGTCCQCIISWLTSRSAVDQQQQHVQQCLEHQEQDQGERLPLHVVGISNINHCSKPLKRGTCSFSVGTRRNAYSRR